MRKIAGFLEQLFDEESFDVKFNFLTENVTIKGSKNKNDQLTKLVEKLLTENANQLKEAYLKDLKKKFPIQLTIDLARVEVSLSYKNKHVDNVNIFMTSLLHKSVDKDQKNYTQTTLRLLQDYFEKSEWKKINPAMYQKEIKNAEALQIIFSQIYHIFEDKPDLQKHVTDWKTFFKE
jgi:hypothetical protein